ncbi:uncharacterized protein LOC120013555 isoform X2 [Tripterygium wilfordii]|uniref:uncharacterized protein LOC120013555 isoform X2 n=1 Tax=Tripterygium wilfordii TaxID=458696 RepID=UPI0018F7FD5D|nr:uncharacterized protein LOC120013555 isoform X2 [Tripterygium wilfordii]
MSTKGKDIVVDAGDANFKWDNKNTKLFLDMLTVWKKKNVGLLKWEPISEEFKKVGGFTSTPLKLKTKHDNMKQNWQQFNRLKNSETGLRFNAETGKENINLKKFHSIGLPLREEQDKLWGGATATGDKCISPAIADVDDSSTPQPVQTDLEHGPEDFSTGSSPVKTTTVNEPSGSTSRTRKRKNKPVEDVIKFKALCLDLKTTSTEQHEYFASKKVYYDKMTMELDAVNTYDQCVKALGELHNQESYADIYYFVVELFASCVHRNLYLALPHESRFGYIERLYNKNGGFALSG